LRVEDRCLILRSKPDWHREDQIGQPIAEVKIMATSDTREGAAAMTDESSERSLTAKPMNWIAGVRQFVREVSLEMKKVSWPTRVEVVNTTIIVLIVIFFFAVFLFVADIGLSYLIAGIEWLAKKVFV
jgi:preprotein translocase subunit SecE